MASAYGSAFATGIDAFGSAYASGVLKRSQYEANRIVSNAMADYNDTMRDIHNRAANFNARQQANVVTMNDLFTTAASVKQKVDIQKQGMEAAGKLSVMSNMSGTAGKTATRLQQQVKDSVALAIHNVDKTTERAQLNSILQREGIESARKRGQDYSVNIKQEGYSGNPLFDGVVAGAVGVGATYAKLGNSTSTTSNWKTAEQGIAEQNVGFYSLPK